MNNIIDLDAKLSLTKSMKIAGKVYEVQISDEIDGLLLNTISFFEEMGVSFEAADEKAGRDILEGESGE